MWRWGVRSRPSKFIYESDAMRTRLYLAIAISCALLIACATTFDPRALPACNQSGVCHINISVVNGRVVVDPPTARITRERVLVQWHLAQGLEFREARDGIEFKGDTKNQFYDREVSQNKKNFFWRDKNSVKGFFDYWVIFHDSEGRRYEHDPTIMNDAE